MEAYLAGHFNGLSLVLFAAGLLILLKAGWPKRAPRADRNGHIWVKPKATARLYDPTCSECGKPASKVAGSDCWPIDRR